MSEDLLPQSSVEPVASEATASQSEEASSSSIETTMGAAFDKAVTEQKERDDKRRDIVRGARGTFAKRANAVPTAKTDPTPSPSEQQAQSPLIEPSPVTARQAPSSWPSELRNEFGKLPSNVQDFLDRREREAHQKITSLGQTARAAEQFKEIGERFQSLRGVDHADAFTKLAAANEALEANPLEGVRYLINHYGIDPRQLVGDLPAAQPDVRLQELHEHLNQSAEIEVQTARMDALVADFAKDKPHWSEVENEVGAQVRAIRAASPNLPEHVVLQRAYDRALKLNDTVQAKLTAAQKVEAEKAARAEAARRALSARKAGTLNVRSTVSGSPAARGSWEDTMRDAAERIMGR